MNALDRPYGAEDTFQGIYGLGLCKAYRGRPVLNQVEFVLKPGEIVGILGPNGSGKTTLFSIISGALNPDQGDIFINDYAVTRLPMFQRARLGLGYLPQESSIFQGLTTAQNIEAILAFTIKNKARRREELDHLIEEFGLERVRNSKATLLSGGERRRLEIARATATKPRYLLLDEPFAGVDPLAITDLRMMINYLRDQGIGILITDHNVRETLESVDRAYIIYAGQIITEGAPDDIYQNPSVRQLYLGEHFKR